MSFEITWLDAGRAPTQPPNPAYPLGVSLNLAGADEPACLADLPYPAPRVGQWRLVCTTCGFAVHVTAAGRADDPRSVRVPCKLPRTQQEDRR